MKKCFVFLAVVTLLTGCGYYTLSPPDPAVKNQGNPLPLTLGLKINVNLESPGETELPVSSEPLAELASSYYTEYFKNTNLFSKVIRGSPGDVELQIVIRKVNDEIKKFGQLRSVKGRYKTTVVAKYYILNSTDPDFSGKGKITGYGFVEAEEEPGISQYRQARSQAFKRIGDELYRRVKNSVEKIRTPEEEPEKEKKEDKGENWTPVQPR